MNAPDSTAPLRILLADDHELLRLGTAKFLKQKLGCEICAEASDGREALRLAESTQPHVAVIDVGLPGLNGLDVTQQMRRASPKTEVVILTGEASSDMINRAFEAGAKAFIVKVDVPIHLVEAIKMAASHRFYITPHAHQTLHPQKPIKKAPRALEEDTPPALTARERETVQLVAEGKSNKEVAALLGISVKTVETHRATIMRKLRLKRLSELVRYALRHKIINP